MATWPATAVLPADRPAAAAMLRPYDTVGRYGGEEFFGRAARLRGE